MPHGLRHSHVDHTVCHATTDYRPGAQIQDLPKELVCQVMNMDLLAALWYHIVQLGMLEIRELIFVRRLMRMAHSLGRRTIRTMYIWRSWRRSHHKTTPEKWLPLYCYIAPSEILCSACWDCHAPWCRDGKLLSGGPTHGPDLGVSTSTIGDNPCSNPSIYKQLLPRVS